MNHTHTVTLEIEEDEVPGLDYGDYEIEVVYYCTPYTPACVDGPSDRWHPEEGGDVEIGKVTLPDGRELWDVYTGDKDMLHDRVVKALLNQIGEQ